MKKFLVLNMNFQPLNPAQFGFNKPSLNNEDEESNVYNPHHNMFLLEEADAKKFAEHMAATQGVGNQKFHLVELKGTAQQARAPIEWV